MPKLIDSDALFQATIQAFVEHGFDGMTTQDVARRAGINEVTIYRRFGTKSALVVAAVTHGVSTAPFASLVIGEDVESDLLAMVEAFEATTRMLGGAVITLLTEAAHHPELRSAMAPLLANIGGEVTVLQAHQDRGSLVAGDPWRQVLLLLSPLVAGGLWARSGVEVPAEMDARSIVAAFLNGHRTPTG